MSSEIKLEALVTKMESAIQRILLRMQELSETGIDSNALAAEITTELEGNNPARDLEEASLRIRALTLSTLVESEVVISSTEDLYQNLSERTVEPAELEPVSRFFSVLYSAQNKVKHIGHGFAVDTSDGPVSLDLRAGPGSWGGGQFGLSSDTCVQVFAFRDYNGTFDVNPLTVTIDSRRPSSEIIILGDDVVQEADTSAPQTVTFDQAGMSGVIVIAPVSTMTSAFFFDVMQGSVPPFTIAVGVIRDFDYLSAQPKGKGTYEILEDKDYEPENASLIPGGGTDFYDIARKVKIEREHDGVLRVTGALKEGGFSKIAFNKGSLLHTSDAEITADVPPKAFIVSASPMVGVDKSSGARSSIIKIPDTSPLTPKDGYLGTIDFDLGTTGEVIYDTALQENNNGPVFMAVLFWDPAEPNAVKMALKTTKRLDPEDHTVEGLSNINIITVPIDGPQTEAYARQADYTINTMVSDVFNAGSQDPSIEIFFAVGKNNGDTLAYTTFQVNTGYDLATETANMSLRVGYRTQFNSTIRHVGNQIDVEDFGYEWVAADGSSTYTVAHNSTEAYLITSIPSFYADRGLIFNVPQQYHGYTGITSSMSRTIGEDATLPGRVFYVSDSEGHPEISMSYVRAIGNGFTANPEGAFDKRERFTFYNYNTVLPANGPIGKIFPSTFNEAFAVISEDGNTVTAVMLASVISDGAYNNLTTQERWSDQAFRSKSEFDDLCVDVAAVDLPGVKDIKFVNPYADIDHGLVMLATCERTNNAGDTIYDVYLLKVSPRRSAETENDTGSPFYDGTNNISVNHVYSGFSVQNLSDNGISNPTMSPRFFYPYEDRKIFGVVDNAVGNGTLTVDLFAPTLNLLNKYGFMAIY